MEKANLFSPITIKGLTLKNRIAVSPMQQYSVTDGLVGNWHLVHLGSRAVGGAGLIITECSAVSEDGRNTLFDTGIWNDTQVEAWKPVVKFVQEQGSKIAIQLWHSGGKGSHTHPTQGFKHMSVEDGGWDTKSSSAHSFEKGQFSQALSIEEIQMIKADFVQAALRSVEAGFDSIELHAGHGYLFHQFYSALVNTRMDEYGGSFENRIRLLVETVQDIKKVLPETMPVMVRISAVDYSEEANGWTIEDSVKLVNILKENGVDVVTASAGGFVSFAKLNVFPNYQLPLAEKVKAETGIITGTVGMITEAEQANEIIVNGQADLIVIAKEFLRDPYFPLNAAKTLKLETEIPVPYSRAF